MPEAELAHQYVVRDSGEVRDERLYWDKAVRFLYSSVRENAPRLFAALTSARVSSFLAFLSYESFVGRSLSGSRRFLAECGIDLTECADDPATLRSLGQIFERQIRYWEKRPMEESAAVVVAPADARMVWGSLRGQVPLLIKGKFFEVEELLGPVRDARRFGDGDWAIFRLTPDKYHYDHSPVAGVVTDFAAISGACHACNPSAVVEMVNPYEKSAGCDHHRHRCGRGQRGGFGSDGRGRRAHDRGYCAVLQRGSLPCAQGDGGWHVPAPGSSQESLSAGGKHRRLAVRGGAHPH